MKNVKIVLADKILIMKLEGKHTTASGLEFTDDGTSLPTAEVVLVSKSLSDKMKEGLIDEVKVGDIVHYTVARESGKCRHKGEEHFIIPIANAVAILDDE